jgi:hypothetical protein
VRFQDSGHELRVGACGRLGRDARASALAGMGLGDNQCRIRRPVTSEPTDASDSASQRTNVRRWCDGTQHASTPNFPPCDVLLYCSQRFHVTLELLHR